MPRWDPDARGRLQQAAMLLYADRGFDETTVADIAARAGLTERTFFRHFADKREVLFSGSEQLQRAIVSGVADAPGGASPIDAVVAGIELAGAFFDDDRRHHARRRQAVIGANADLRERELIKLASLRAGIAESLRRRGVPGSLASLSAEAGMGVFSVAFERWIESDNERDWSTLVNESADHLKELITARRGAPSP